MVVANDKHNVGINCNLQVIIVPVAATWEISTQYNY